MSDHLRYETIRSQLKLPEILTEKSVVVSEILTESPDSEVLTVAVDLIINHLIISVPQT